jgi:hypothetical protein
MSLVRHEIFQLDAGSRQVVGVFAVPELPPLVMQIQRINIHLESFFSVTRVESLSLSQHLKYIGCSIQV